MEPAHQDASAADLLSWSTWPQACWLIARGHTRRPALRVALVVGTLLSLVNQSGVILHETFSAKVVAQIAANYAIPYVVSSIGFLNAHRGLTGRHGSGS